MPIYRDILAIAGTDQPAPAPIESDFFTSGFDLPAEPATTPAPRRQPQSPLKDWRFIIDRAFMRGLSAAAIRQAIGNEIAGHPEAAKIEAYLAKYEGLIGTVFVDSAVVAAGFPLARIPRTFAPYHRYAINCRDWREVTRTRAAGGVSGDIDAFLNSLDGEATDTFRVCRVTGLPVLEKGAFGEAEIAELLQLAGGTGSTLADLQKVLKEKCLGIGVAEPSKPQAATPDLNYGLREEEMDAPVADAPEAPDSPFKYNLAPAGIKAKAAAALPTEDGQYALAEAGIRAVATKAAPAPLAVTAPAASAKEDIALPAAAPTPIAVRPEASAKPDVAFAAPARALPAADAYALVEPEAAVVEIALPPETLEDVEPDWAVAGEADIAFADPVDELDGIRLDGGLRF